MKRPLYRNKRDEVTGFLDASGALTLVVTCPWGPSWEVRQVGVHVDNPTVEPFCTTYIGTNDAGIYISQTFTGSDDTDSIPNTRLNAGDSICAVWTGGAPGARARFTILYDEVSH